MEINELNIDKTDMQSQNKENLIEKWNLKQWNSFSSVFIQHIYLLLSEFDMFEVNEKTRKRGSKIFIMSLRLLRRAGKETSRSQAEGSTATKKD